jgi:Flp pilus assembly pilin Flp
MRALVLVAQRFAVRCRLAFSARDDAGQATTEYALVLLGAALIALLLVAWATTGGGGGKIGGLLDRVFQSITRRIS